MKDTPLRVGVIGLGAMGQHHVRVWSQMEGADLVAVCDPDRARVREVMKRYNPTSTRHYESSIDMYAEETIDAVSICTPTILHYAEADFALDCGCHVLVEKPITESPRQAQDIIALADKKNLILTVGHIERYNPAAIAAQRIYHERELGKIRAIHIRRVGPNPERIRDVGVVLDLAVHDIDLAHCITKNPPTVLYSRLYHCIHGPHIEDGADVLLDYGGIPVFLTTNWLTSAKIRELTIICDKGTIIADLFHKKVELWHRYDDVEEIKTTGQEPLVTEIEEFIKAINSQPANITPPEDATLALEAALEIIRIGRTE